MNWELVYLKEHDIVKVTVSGEATLEELKQQISDIIRTTTANQNCNRVLIDYQALGHDLRVIDIYNLPELIQSLGANRARRVAILISQDTPNRDDFEFYENRAQNYGFDHR